MGAWSECTGPIRKPTDVLEWVAADTHALLVEAQHFPPEFFDLKTGFAGELLQKLDRAAEDSGRTPELLIQVDLAGEATKFGVPPGDVPRLFEAAGACRAARIVGLMTLPPIPDTPEDARPWFRRLRDLRDGWLASGVSAPMLREL